MTHVTVSLTTNLNIAKRCMFCTLDLKNKAIGCPTHLICEHIDSKHNDKRSMNEYVTYGSFCSYNCAKAFAISREKDPLFINSCRYLSIIASKESEDIIDILPSPPIEILNLYGGYMTEEQYRKELGKIQYKPNGTTITHPITLVYVRH